MLRWNLDMTNGHTATKNMVEAEGESWGTLQVHSFLPRHGFCFFIAMCPTERGEELSKSSKTIKDVELAKMLNTTRKELTRRRKKGEATGLQHVLFPSLSTSGLR